MTHQFLIWLTDRTFYQIAGWNRKTNSATVSVCAELWRGVPRRRERRTDASSSAGAQEIAAAPTEWRVSESFLSDSPIFRPITDMLLLKLGNKKSADLAAVCCWSGSTTGQLIASRPDKRTQWPRVPPERPPTVFCVSVPPVRPSSRPSTQSASRSSAPRAVIDCARSVEIYLFLVRSQFGVLKHNFPHTQADAFYGEKRTARVVSLANSIFRTFYVEFRFTENLNLCLCFNSNVREQS